jgi:putative tryptophan/tyrosine transport system substrate-binding protein
MTRPPSPLTMLLSRHTRRRDFIAGLGGAAAWPLAVCAQQPALPVVGLIRGGSLDTSAHYLAAFRAGLRETGYVEGQNVTVEYHWLEGQLDRVPAVVADLVRRRVAVIAIPGNPTTAQTARAATTTIPIVFGVGDDPVKLGLVASLSRPGGNATGINSFTLEAVPKRLGLLHELLPTAARLGVLVNPASTAAAESTLREVQDAARLLGLLINVFKAGTSREIEAAFATMIRERVEALFVATDGYFESRRVQLVTLAAHHRIPTCYANRDFVEAGGLMSYGTSSPDMWHHVGAYTGQILRGAKPAELPVVQSTKFEFVINMQTARALGIDVPPGLLASTNEVIE